MEVTLIYPHQLFAEHPALAKGRPVFLIEEPLILGTDPEWPMRLHVQKRIFHRATLKQYGEKLQTEGYEVTYLECDQLAGSTVLDFVPEETTSAHLALLCDDLLSRRLAKAAQDKNIALEACTSPMFLSPRAWLSEELSKGKKPFMARFYKSQRRRMNILVDPDGEPEGGQWSYDEDNRKKLPKNHQVPDNPSSHEHDSVEEARSYVGSHFNDSLGSADSFVWPTNHQQASAWLDDFLERRLELFGDYEDALSSKERVLYHSQLTPMLNCGLLTPDEVIKRTLKTARERDIPINSLEGFIRQIIGWREFMFGMYQFHGRQGRTSNFWGFKRTMPEKFYTGETGIPPLDQVIKRALDHNYSHHIERLMVLGSFMLLCRIDPDAVYKWFMELFIDAYDWVMVPNVYGMSQFADGGVFTTKPYLCGSNYIRKMSDYSKGEWCDIWDGLYWTFIADYKEVFAANHRMSMMARNVDRMDEDKLATHRQNAEQFLDSLWQNCSS